MSDRLKDVLVVSVEQAVAAPYATSRLADAGARVIKIERPEGDFARSYDQHINGECSWFVWLNRGKESVILDFKNRDDSRFLDQLISHADIFVQNLAPGAAIRGGFGSELLRKRYPSLITCDISGYGDSGPYRDMKAYDFLIQCEAGIASMTGTPEEPARVGVSACDLSAGLNAYGAILEALFARARHGEGDSISISLFDGMADWMNVPLLHHIHRGRAPTRNGLSHAMIAPYGAYSVGDGSRIVIAIQNDREWVEFCGKVLDRKALAQDQMFSSNAARVKNRKNLDALITECFSTYSMDSLCSCLFKAKIAFGRLNEVSDLVAHPQLRWMPVNTASGKVNIVAPPAKFFSQGSSNVATVPTLGEHTKRIWTEFSAYKDKK